MKFLENLAMVGKKVTWLWW